MKKLVIWFIGFCTLGTGGAVYGDAQINPYIDKGQYFELPIVSDFPQGERIEISKDKAQMDLVGWNDEYRISITPQIPTAHLGVIDRPFIKEANRPLLSKKMEYREGDVTAFIEPKTQNEFDIDFTLHSKPDTNVFQYSIEGAEDFDFFYQPELTPEEIAEGGSRPENVIGSYAVYHKTKANHRVGSTNYATGKAFHIYRPKAIDNNDAEVWAELNYENGILSVTVPQKFLDDAVYPVRVDPTFGYTTVGGSFLTNTGGATLTALTSLVNTITASTENSTTNIQIYGDYGVSGTGTFDVAVYEVSSGAPAARNGVAAELTLTTTTQWHVLSFVRVLTNGVIYAVALANTTADTNNKRIAYDEGVAPGRVNSTDAPTATLKDPFGAVSTDSGRHYSIYTTYIDGPSGGSVNLHINGNTFINGNVFVQ